MFEAAKIIGADLRSAMILIYGIIAIVLIAFQWVFRRA